MGTMKKYSIKKKLCIGCAIVLLLGAAIGFYIADYYNLLPKKTYTAEDFNIQTVTSTVDYNKNGVDDYTDILLGARKDAENHPSYESAYYAGGYPPEDIGVCTDVIWRAFKNAGYSLKDMVNNDIAENTDQYLRVTGDPDPNIDFRRVPNLKVFFERYALSLTTDPENLSEWQPGDIVTYGNSHIAIVSDKRNKYGVPYIIHNGGQPIREEDALTRMGISGHYRFDASLVPSDILQPFAE